jgi:hypothetical protein
VRLDLEQNPGNYLASRCDPDKDGKLVVSIQNATPLPVSNVTVSVQYSDGGAARRLDRRIGGRLAPGQVASVTTGLGPYLAGSRCPATVTSARIAN